MRNKFLLPLAAFAMTAAGCAAKAEHDALPPPMGDTKSENGAVPAPETGAAVHITVADNSKTVAVAVGKAFDVALVGVPTAGYLWKASSIPDFVTQTGTSGGPTTQAQKQPGFAGGNHWEVTSFVAARAGKGVLKFEQRRPWETNEPPAATFSVTIEAK
jgi:predicted secreted protein